MSFASLPSSVRNILGAPSTKIPADVATFVSYILPPVVCYFVAAYLAVTPQTRAFRVAFWPVTTLLALRAALSVEMAFLNIDLVPFMISIVVNSLFWTLARKPFVRYLRPTNSSRSVIMDSLDLALNSRGHGWEWARGLSFPRETRPTGRIPFATYALLSAAAHYPISGSTYFAIQITTTHGGSSSQGPTIFDESLPFFARYLRSSIISTFIAFRIYSVMQTAYDLCTIPAVLFLGQDPAQWPPAFESPWWATSLNDFWGRRWHQWLRQTFLMGTYPFSLVLGRAGTVIGAFMWSGIYHHVMLRAFDNRSEMWRMVVPFGMMALGVLAERAFYRSTGRKVGGVVGWVWTIGWLVLWGNVIAEGFVRSGMFLPSTTTDSQSTLRMLVEKLVARVDAYLYTV